MNVSLDFIKMQNVIMIFELDESKSSASFWEVFEIYHASGMRFLCIGKDEGSSQNGRFTAQFLASLMGKMTIIDDKTIVILGYPIFWHTHVATWDWEYVGNWKPLSWLKSPKDMYIYTVYTYTYIYMYVYI